MRTHLKCRLCLAPRVPSLPGSTHHSRMLSATFPVPTMRDAKPSPVTSRVRGAKHAAEAFLSDSLVPSAEPGPEWVLST